jgi:hypothetical protein
MKTKFFSSVAFMAAAVCALGGCPMPGNDLPDPPSAPATPASGPDGSSGKAKPSIALQWKAGEGFADPGEGAFTITESLTLTKGGAASAAEINLQGPFTAYVWNVDNTLKGRGSLNPDETPEISLDARDYSVGPHRLDIIVYDAAGVPYSKGLSFEVKNEGE